MGASRYHSSLGETAPVESGEPREKSRAHMFMIWKMVGSSLTSCACGGGGCS
jgi:hypothetical protein